MSVVRIKLKDWTLSVNKAETSTYAKAELVDHCTCGYCRNFYETVDTYYPCLRTFLNRLGVEICAPASLVPYELGDEICYDAAYVASGRLLEAGKQPISLDNVQIIIKPQVDIPCDLEEPVLLLSVPNLILPWVQPEAFDQVASPVKEQKIRDQLLNLLYNEEDPFTFS